MNRREIKALCIQDALAQTDGEISVHTAEWVVEAILETIVNYTASAQTAAELTLIREGCRS